MARRRIKGVLKDYHVPGSTKHGYRSVWDMGSAADHKKRTRITGINRPSV